MPFPNFHTAVIVSKEQFDPKTFRTKQLRKGISIIIGKLKNGEGTMVTHSYRFDKNIFTVKQAKKWLKHNKIRYISFEPASEKTDMTQLEYKSFDFKVLDVKEEIRKKADGKEENYGVIYGYASTFGNVDQGGDIVEKGAFTESLKENKKPYIKMKYQHSYHDIIGGFPIDSIKEDDKGLFVKGEINLGVQKGRETYALAKQGVLSDFSIGYFIINASEDYILRGEERIPVKRLKTIDLREISVVGEPMNTEAEFTEVKSKSVEDGELDTNNDFNDDEIEGLNIEDDKAVSGGNLPLAARDMKWSEREARDRVRKNTGSTDKPSGRYKRAFFWYDAENADKFSAYKFPFADVVGGQLKAIPRAIFNAAARLKNSNIPEADKTKIIAKINRYYAKMRREFDDDSIVSPFEKKNLKELLVDMKSINHYLKYPYSLTDNERNIFISKIKEFSKQRDVATNNNVDASSARDVSEDESIKNIGNIIVKKLDDIINLTQSKEFNHARNSNTDRN